MNSKFVCICRGGVGISKNNKYILPPPFFSPSTHRLTHLDALTFRQSSINPLQQASQWRPSSRFIGFSNVPADLLLSLSLLTLSASPRNAANYVSDTVKGAGSQASSTANKEVAKDSDASISTRATAAKDAVFDKIDQKSHDVRLPQSSSRTWTNISQASANVHKEAAKH
jgi:hypothetical protein